MNRGWPWRHGARALTAMLFAGVIAAASAGSASASSVIAPTVQLSTTAANATGVTYAVEFAAPHGLAASGDTITIAAPSGTGIPNQSILVHDLTTGQDVGYTSAPMLSNGGATAVWTTQSGTAVPAGDTVRLEIPGVTNAPAGRGQLRVSTSADSTSAGTSSFTLTARGSLSSPSISLSTSAIGVAGVTYKIGFTTSSTGAVVANQGLVTVALPTGSVIPNQCMAVFDLTGNRDLGCVYNPTFSNGNATATWTPSGTIPAGHRIELTIAGVTNPSAGGNVTVSTSSDGSTSVGLPGLTARGSVSSPSVSLSTSAIGVAGVTYRVGFATSSTGAVVANQGLVTVALPTGSVIPNECIGVFDLTLNRDLGCAYSATFSNGNATATWTASGTIPAGHRIELTIAGVTNPSAGGNVTVSTSSDRSTSVPLPALTARGSVSSPSVSFSTSAIGAAAVTYKVGFATSSTGAVVAGQGTVTVALPTGTVIPNQCADVFDLTGNRDLGCAYTPQFQNGNATATWTPSATIPAGHRFELTITGATNPSAGGNVTVSTSSDKSATAPTPGLTARRAAGLPTLAVSNQTAAATGVVYSIDFTASPTGTVIANQGSVTVALPTGTVIPNQCVEVTDVTEQQDLGCAYGPSFANGNATATWTASSTIRAGDRIRVTIPGVTNPAAGSGYLAHVSTASDSAASTPAYAIGPASPPVTVSPTALLTSTAAGVPHIGYTVIFTSTSSGIAASTGTISLAVPAGTSLPTQGVDVYDITAGLALGATSAPTVTGSTYTYTLGSNPVPGSHQVQVTVADATNPAATGTDTISINTSGGAIGRTNTYQIVTPGSVSSPSVGVSSTAAGVAHVTYSIGMTVSSSGALAAGFGTIRVQAPSGTVLPQAGFTIDDLTTGDQLGVYAPASAGNDVTYTVVDSVGAGDRLRLKITDVTNPAVAGNVTVSTSSDRGASAAMPAMTTAGSVSSPSVGVSSTAAGVAHVTYSIGMTVSSSGALAAGFGTIRVQAPSGTVLPQAGFTIDDLTTGDQLGVYAPASAGNDVTYTVVDSVGAGDRLRLKITDVTNPAVAGNVTVSTSSDRGASAAMPAMTTAGSVSSPSVGVSSTAAGVAHVTYSIGMTVSSSGALAAGFGTIRVQAPSGTVLPQAGFTIDDLTTGDQLGVYAPASAGNDVTYTVVDSVGAGDRLRLKITDVTNPAVAGNVTVSTSSDRGASAAMPAMTTAGSVSSPSVGVSSTAAGVAHVTYSIGMTVSSSGALAAGFGTIRVQAPSGTVLPQAGFTIDDLTTGDQLGVYAPASAGNDVTYTVVDSVGAGDRLRLKITDVTNPPAGRYALALSTSSDSGTAGRTPLYTIGTPTVAGAPTVALSSTMPGAANVSYTIGLQPAGPLPANSGTITARAPGGTTFATGAIDIFDVTSNTDLGPTSATVLSDGGATATWRVGSTAVPAGHTIKLTVNGVSNPVAGNYQLDLTTSTDTATAQTPTYTIGQQPPPAPSVTGVSPSSGPQAGGTAVTVTGSGFTGATGVQFGSAAAASFTVVSDTKIMATAPSGTGTVDVTVATPAGTSATGGGDKFTYNGPPPPPATPSVSGVSPASGPAGGGAMVTIMGSGFTGATAVTFGSAAAQSFHVDSDIQITAVAPGGQGIVDVRVTTSAGTSPTGAGDQFTFVTSAAPVPSTGPPAAAGSKDAGFSGTVNPEGLQTTAHFEYGLDPKYRAPGDTTIYDQRTPDQIVGADSSPHNVTATVAGLVPNAMYHVRLVATNVAGTTPGQDKTFMTARDVAPLPPPTLGKTVDVAPQSGVVFIKLPGHGASSDRALTKGGGFSPLTEARQLPSGTQVDSRFGSLKLIAAAASSQHIGKTQSVTLGGGLFGLAQARSGISKGLTTFSLLEGDFAGAPSFAGCGHAAADRSGVFAHEAISRRVLQTLRASGHGRFRTRGRYSAGTVRGTVWDTTDRCDGTLTVVHRGTVVVTDFRLRKTIPVRAGHRYLAKFR